MITPNIAPRKIMGSATAGLFSAAKSSIRRVENVTKTISKAPDVKKNKSLELTMFSSSVPRRIQKY